MKANYHTHTRWCRHGKGEIEDYIKEAIRTGLDTLAITEHVPYRSNFDNRRMQWEEFPMFHAELEAAVRKYSGQIRVIRGFECEYCPAVMDDYEVFRRQHGYELMILGHHQSVDQKLFYFADKGENELFQYTNEVIEGLETGFFTFLAHPDVPLHGYHGSMAFAETQMERIFDVCERLDIPVEINANGLRDGRRYPDWHIWELSKHFRLRRIINSDAHFVPHLCDAEGVLAAEKKCEELGIDTIEYLEGI